MGEAVVQQTAPADDVLKTLLALQNEYFERVREAGAAGNTARVQELLGDLQRRTREIMGTPEEPHLKVVKHAVPPPPAVRQIYDNSVCSLDLNGTVYDGDRDTYLSLIDDSHFSNVANALLADHEPYNARKDLLKSALKLTPKLAPKIYAVLERCKAALKLSADLELYVCSDVELNAFCYPPVGGKYILGVTSALLEKFNEEELAFVLGHEIGHAIFGHHRLPVGFLLHHGSGDLSPLHAMRLYSWKRNAEITADRVGLLCGQNFDAAASAFFKLSSGVTSSSLSFQLREYIAQFADLEKELEGTEVDPEDWYSTHPFSPMRLKALDMFHRSETYGRLIGKPNPNAELSEEQLEFQIKKVMSMMEPSYLQESSELGELMKNFVFYGGYLVAAANGAVDEAEITALGSLLMTMEPAAVKARIESLKASNPEEIRGQVATITEKLNVMLPVVSKLNVIKDLTVIAGADGSVEDSELEVLYGITSLLHLRPEFVDHVLNSAGDETSGDDDDE